MNAWAHGEAAPAPDLPGVLWAWPVEPLVWVAVALSAWLYLRAARRVHGWSAARRWCFLLGLATLVVALAGPLATYDGSLFWVHMVQHLLLTAVAPPLLVGGTPITLFLRASHPAARARAVSLLHSGPLRVLSHPAFSWVLFALVMWLTHLSWLYDAALESEALHFAEHVVYLGAGLLFWGPVVGLEPTGGRLSWPARLGYLALAMPQQAFLGLAIYSADSVLYPHYETLQRTWGPSGLDDQRLAGMVMWIGGDFLFLIAQVAGAIAWMKADTREAERIDRRLDGVT